MWDEFQLEIFDHWGELVFKTLDPNYGWNGNKWNSETPSPNGVYGYNMTILDTEGAAIIYTGQIVLNR